MRKTLYSPEYIKLTQWLKNERMRNGLSMRELAKLLDVPHSFIGKIEQGERRLDIIEYISYCNALQIKPEHGFTILNTI